MKMLCYKRSHNLEETVVNLEDILICDSFLKEVFNSNMTANPPVIFNDLLLCQRSERGL
jgi:hypothetical protein